jgi:hypothetical protein
VNAPQLPPRVLRHFIETVARELGNDQFNAMLAISKLPPEWAAPRTFLKSDPRHAAATYAALQAALRTYYGRGARGALIRVGENLWQRLLEDAPFRLKLQSTFIKQIPPAARRKPTLELLARLISAAPGDITLHTLDLDLLLADHASPTADGQTAPLPICYVTQGLIRQSLRWASGVTFDVEETACKAQGSAACEFTIKHSKI